MMLSFSTLIGLISLNFLNIQNTGKQETITTLLVSDLKAQQLKTLTGDTEDQGSRSDFGIYFTPSGYIIFRGSSYSSGNPTNFTITLDTALTFSQIRFPSDSVIFSKGSGEVLGFTEGSNSITLTNTQNNISKTLTINRYGVITSIE